jgi:outer membrane protein OmpA-like peptidoglycan-associated protein
MSPGHVLLVLLTASVIGAPAAEGQLPRKIKESIKGKVKAQKDQTEGQVIDRAGRPADSALAKAGRPVTAAVDKAGDAADSVVWRAARALSAAVKNDDPGLRRISEALARGHAVLPGIRFVGSTDRLAAGSERELARLARALGEVDGQFLVEGHVAPGLSASAGQRLSTKRAALVKRWLVHAGVTPDRLLSTGVGARRPPEAGSAARIEVVRLE